MGRHVTIDAHYHGKGPILYSWHPSSHFVATVGTTKIVHIFDCKGQLMDKFVPGGTCIALEWDISGETLAILQTGVPQEIVLWQFESKEEQRLELNIKEPVLMKWSRDGKLLAVGTARGEVRHEWACRRKSNKIGGHI